MRCESEFRRYSTDEVSPTSRGLGRRSTPAPINNVKSTDLAALHKRFQASVHNLATTRNAFTSTTYLLTYNLHRHAKLLKHTYTCRITLAIIDQVRFHIPSRCDPNNAHSTYYFDNRVVSSIPRKDEAATINALLRSHKTYSRRFSNMR